MALDYDYIRRQDYLLSDGRWLKWDRRMLGLAEHVAQWSKDPSTQVGAVIVRPDFSILSLGFNGFPIGVEDTEERLTNREIKLKMILHAEENALAFAPNPLPVETTIYTWPFPPCTHCAAQIIQRGVWRVVAPEPTPKTEEVLKRWDSDIALAKSMFEEAAITYEIVPLDS